jgi:hypothetical protein
VDAPPYFRQVTIPQAKMTHHQNRQILDIEIKAVNETVELTPAVGRPHTPETGSSLVYASGGAQFGGVDS